MSFSVQVPDAQAPFILALDVGSSGTRGCLYEATGRPLQGRAHRVKVPHTFTTVANGTSTIDPDQVTEEIRHCISHVAGSAPGPIAAVALDTFASSLVGVGADGTASTPCYTYADARSAPQVSYLRSLFNEDEVHQRTGTRQHTGYLPARFLWLKLVDRPGFDRVRHWMSLGEYAYLRLIGTTAAGTSTAAWTGMLNRHAGTWDTELLDIVGVREEQLSPIVAPSRPLTPVTDVGGTWPQLREALWFAPISDGFASSIGAGATDSSTLVAAAATSGAMRVLVDTDVSNLPRGLWCNKVDETRSLLGGALNDVGRVVTWLEQTLRLPDRDAVREMLLADPHPGVPFVLPFFSGERSTGWVGESRAVFHRVSAATTPLELYRGAIEGIAWSYYRMMRELTKVTGQPEQILATGRVSAELPGLTQILADVLDVAVTPIAIKRSTLHGTALHALEIIAPDVPSHPVTLGETCEPDPSRRNYYDRRLERTQILYDKLIAHSN